MKWKKIQRINEKKFFKKINKIDNLSVKLNERKKRRPKLIKSETKESHYNKSNEI